ncbi:two-component system sensor histidine kinase SapS [Enterococcus sp. LJL128]|uniref:two-component system sensor histidine kinase SapS n=1 Tax=Enterococcus sp. LJL51 TaxID=3416656 RepID=UPI003CECC51C
MTARKYLKDHWLFLIGWLLFIGVTCLILWLTPSVKLSTASISYLILLEFLVLVVVLAIDYLVRRRWWKKLDITDPSQRLEEYLKDASREDERLQQEYINSILTEHQKVMEQVIDNQQEHKEYIDSWVHEIKVPLAAVNLLLDSLEDDISEETYSLLENEFLKIDEYVEQVLYYSRLDSFSKDYLIREYSAKKIVQSVIRSQAYYFIQKNIRFSIEGEDQTVLTDGKWVEFIFRQLISNAVKYTPQGGEIKVKISRSREGITLLLEDSGIGIPQNDLQRIFDKGFTGTNGRMLNQHSTGLGLYLAKKLADKLGHQLSIASVEGAGTTAEIFFPFVTYYHEIR